MQVNLEGVGESPWTCDLGQKGCLADCPAFLLLIPGGPVTERGTAEPLHPEGIATWADSADLVVRPPATLFLHRMWLQFAFLRDCHIGNLDSYQDR